jgi:hypothetical protein
MSKRTLQITASALGAALLIALIVVSALRESAGKTAGASATVTRVVFDPAISDSDSDETKVTYSFTAAGGLVEDQQTFSGDQRRIYSEGQQVHVCYNPEKPVSSNIAPASYDCGS